MSVFLLFEDTSSEECLISVHKELIDAQQAGFSLLCSRCCHLSIEEWEFEKTIFKNIWSNSTQTKVWKQTFSEETTVKQVQKHKK